jgi:hypothetical protein
MNNNDIKINNLFKNIFENINNPIIDILKNTNEIKTSEKLDEITRYLYKNFNPIQAKDILNKNGIIYDKQNSNFSAKNYNTFTNLVRAIDNNNIITNYSTVTENIFSPPLDQFNNNIFSPSSMTVPFQNHITNPDKQLFFPNIENNLLPSENIYQNQSMRQPNNSLFDQNNIIIPQHSGVPEPFYNDANNEKYESSQQTSQQTSQAFSQNNSSYNVLPLIENNYNVAVYDSSLPPHSNYLLDPPMTGPGETMLNSLLLSNIQKQIDNLKADEIGCDEKIDKVKKDYQNTINNYIDILLKDLIKNETITEIEANTMKKKLEYKEIDNQTLIKYLQDKQTFSKKISINDEYNQFMKNKFTQPRPPICVTNFPPKITQFDPYDTLYATQK